LSKVELPITETQRKVHRANSQTAFGFMLLVFHVKMTLICLRFKRRRLSSFAVEDRTLTTRVVIVRHGQSSYNTEGASRAAVMRQS